MKTVVIDNRKVEPPQPPRIGDLLPGDIFEHFGESTAGPAIRTVTGYVYLKNGSVFPLTSNSQARVRLLKTSLHIEGEV